MARESLEINYIRRKYDRIVLSVVVHPIGNKIIVCYVISTSKCEISFPVIFKPFNSGEGYIGVLSSMAN